MFDKIDNFALIIIILLIVSFMSTSKTPIHNDGSVNIPQDTVSDEVLPSPQDDQMPSPDDSSLSVVDTHGVRDDVWTDMNETTGAIGSDLRKEQNDENNVSNIMGGIYDGDSGGSFASVDYSDCNTKSCQLMNGYDTMNKLNMAKALKANDLKPQETNNVPWDQPHQVLDDNIIEDRIASIGISTKSSSLRNANLQIRPDPRIQHQMVGPWNMSTITPDYNRKSLC